MIWQRHNVVALLLVLNRYWASPFYTGWLAAAISPYELPVVFTEGSVRLRYISDAEDTVGP